MSTLPAELFHLILAAAWTSALTPGERITLMTSSPRVSRAWAAAFATLAAADVHIPAPSYVDTFLVCIAAAPAAAAAAHSLTFHLAHPASMDAARSAQNTRGEALSRTLYALTSRALLPNLRRVSIRYTNFGTDDAVRYARLFSFPPSVAALSLSYAFDAHSPPASIARWRAQPARDAGVLDALPHVRHLAVFGAGPGLVVDLMNMCARAQEVVTDARVEARGTWFVHHAEEGGVRVYRSGSTMLRKLLHASIAREEEEEEED